MATEKPSLSETPVKVGAEASVAPRRRAGSLASDSRHGVDGAVTAATLSAIGLGLAAEMATAHSAQNPLVPNGQSDDLAAGSDRPAPVIGDADEPDLLLGGLGGMSAFIGTEDGQQLADATPRAADAAPVAPATPEVAPVAAAPQFAPSLNGDSYNGAGDAPVRTAVGVTRPEGSEALAPSVVAAPSVATKPVNFIPVEDDTEDTADAGQGAVPVAAPQPASVAPIELDDGGADAGAPTAPTPPASSAPPADPVSPPSPGVAVPVPPAADIGNSVGDILSPVIGDGGVLDTVTDTLLGDGGVVDSILSPVLGDGGVLDTVTDTLLGDGGVVDSILSPVLGDGGVLDTVTDTLLGEGGVVDSILSPVLGDGGVVGVITGSLLGEGGLVGTIVAPVLGDSGAVDTVLDTVVGPEGLITGVLDTVGNNVLAPVLGGDGILGSVADTLGGGLLAPILSADGGLGGLLGGLLGSSGAGASVVAPVLGPQGAVGSLTGTLAGEGSALQGTVGAVADTVLNPLLGQDGVLGGAVDTLLGQDGTLHSVLTPIVGEGGVVNEITDTLIGNESAVAGLVDTLGGAVLDPLLGGDSALATLLSPVAGPDGLLSPVLEEGGVVDQVTNGLADSVIAPILGGDGLLGTALDPILGDGSVLDTALQPLIGDGGIVATITAPLLGDNGLLPNLLDPILGQDSALGQALDPLVGQGGVLDTLLSPVLDALGPVGDLVDGLIGSIFSGWRGGRDAPEAAPSSDAAPASAAVVADIGFEAAPVSAQSLGTISAAILPSNSFAQTLSDGFEALTGRFAGLFSSLPSGSNARSQPVVDSEAPSASEALVPDAPAEADAPINAPSDPLPSPSIPPVLGVQTAGGALLGAAVAPLAVADLGASVTALFPRLTGLFGRRTAQTEPEPEPLDPEATDPDADDFLETLIGADSLFAGADSYDALAEVLSLPTDRVIAGLLSDEIEDSPELPAQEDLLGEMFDLGLTGALADHTAPVDPAAQVADVEIDDLLNAILDSDEQAISGITDPFGTLLDAAQDDGIAGGIFEQEMGAAVDGALDALFGPLSVEAEVHGASLVDHGPVGGDGLNGQDEEH